MDHKYCTKKSIFKKFCLRLVWSIMIWKSASWRTLPCHGIWWSDNAYMLTDWDKEYSIWMEFMNTTRVSKFFILPYLCYLWFLVINFVRGNIFKAMLADFWNCHHCIQEIAISHRICSKNSQHDAVNYIRQVGRESMLRTSASPVIYLSLTS